MAWLFVENKTQGKKIKMKPILAFAFSLLMGLQAGPLFPALAHNGVDHSATKHRLVEGVDISFEIQPLAKYKHLFGEISELSGSHVLLVHLSKQKKELTDAQIKVKIIGSDKKTVGAENGQALKLVSPKNKHAHFATAYTLKPGKYMVVLVFKHDQQISQAAFEVNI
jgi:hypothetical protein